MTLPPLSLYIHIPWCIKKCPYCDFNSYGLPNPTLATRQLPEAEYVAALLQDLTLALPTINGRTIKSIFIGGGTPSLFSGKSIDRLLTGIATKLSLADEIEITLEANPGTTELDHLLAYKQSGINRISLGVQSFNDYHLKVLGRIHSSAQARHAIDATLAIFNNVNLDIMYGLPQQSLADAIQDFQIATTFNPTHISAYNLTIEPGTGFAKRPPALPDNDSCYEMQTSIHDLLTKHNYQQYEIAAFSRQQQCDHNLNYWQFGDYIGIGAGAHSKISNCVKIIRQERCKNPQDYMLKVQSSTHIQAEYMIDYNNLPGEFMMNALRLSAGIEYETFTRHTGLSLSVIAATVELAQARGLLQYSTQKIIPTTLGHNFLNDLISMFLV
jgi:putative oxygen-independent coproporphyrinogen III oxidase